MNRVIDALFREAAEYNIKFAAPGFPGQGMPPGGPAVQGQPNVQFHHVYPPGQGAPQGGAPNGDPNGAPARPAPDPAEVEGKIHRGVANHLLGRNSLHAGVVKPSKFKELLRNRGFRGAATPERIHAFLAADTPGMSPDHAQAFLQTGLKVVPNHKSQFGTAIQRLKVHDEEQAALKHQMAPGAGSAIGHVLGAPFRAIGAGLGQAAGAFQSARAQPQQQEAAPAPAAGSQLGIGLPAAMLGAYALSNVFGNRQSPQWPAPVAAAPQE